MLPAVFKKKKERYPCNQVLYNRPGFLRKNTNIAGLGILLVDALRHPGILSGNILKVT
jgi:hypothetical protein